MAASTVVHGVTAAPRGVAYGVVTRSGRVGSGLRTLTRLNAFDLVVTVAFGSTLATMLLNDTVSWA